MRPSRRFLVLIHVAAVVMAVVVLAPFAPPPQTATNRCAPG